MKRGLTALCLLSLSGCFYTFDNPVELQDAGSIAGHVVITQNNSGLSPGGGQVGLLWTDLAITVRDDGRFLFLGLPDGVYTLKYELDPGDGGLPLIFFLPGIKLPVEPGNIPDAIDLGSIVLAPVARVTGHVALGDGGPAVVGAFSQNDAGQEIFESFTVMTDDDGSFTLDLPSGSHDIWASTATLSGATPISVPSGQVTDLGELTLDPPVFGSNADRRPGPRSDPNNGDPNGELVGDLVLGLPGFGASADPGAVADAGLVQGNVEINPPQQDPFALSGQVKGKGAHMDQTLPPGQLYPSIYCGLKGSQPPGPTTLNDIGLNGIPTFVGHSTILGQITWLPVSTFAANSQPPPPDYSSGATSSSTGTGSSTGGTSSGGASSGSGGGGSSTGGTTGGIPDSGPTFQGWEELAEAPLADAGTTNGPFIPIPMDGGPMLFSTDGLVLYLATSANGQLAPFDFYTSPGIFISLLAATTDELGVPSALLNYYEPANQSYALIVAQRSSTGRWAITTCDPATYTYYGAAAIMAAPRGSSAKGGPSAFVIYLDSNSHLQVAPFFAGRKGCAPAEVNSPTSGDAGIGFFQGVAGASCTVNGDPGACLALGGYSDEVWALAIDLLSPPNSLADPLLLSQFTSSPTTPAGLSAVVTGPPGSELLTATWQEMYVDPANGQMIAQRTPVVNLTVANPGQLPPPLAFDAGIDHDAGTPIYAFSTTLALSSDGLPLVVAQARTTAFTSFEPPPRYFVFDLIGGAPLPDLPSDAGVAAPLAGYVDDNGNPVVGLAADDPASLNGQIWTYYP